MDDCNTALNIRQLGYGKCPKHGVNTFSGPTGVVCLSCGAEKDGGHGETVILTEPHGEKGPVHIQVLAQHGAILADSVATAKLNPPNKTIRLDISVDDLMSSNILITLLQKIHAGIDDMSPPTSIKEMKKIVSIQEGIQNLIDRLIKGAE